MWVWKIWNNNGRKLRIKNQACYLYNPHKTDDIVKLIDTDAVINDNPVLISQNRII